MLTVLFQKLFLIGPGDVLRFKPLNLNDTFVSSSFSLILIGILFISLSLGVYYVYSIKDSSVDGKEKDDV